MAPDEKRIAEEGRRRYRTISVERDLEHVYVVVQQQRLYEYGELAWLEPSHSEWRWELFEFSYNLKTRQMEQESVPTDSFPALGREVALRELYSRGYIEKDQIV